MSHARLAVSVITRTESVLTVFVITEIASVLAVSVSRERDREREKERERASTLAVSGITETASTQRQ